jgi:hypothetical protein
VVAVLIPPVALLRFTPVGQVPTFATCAFAPEPPPVTGVAPFTVSVVSKLPTGCVVAPAGAEMVTRFARIEAVMMVTVTLLVAQVTGVSKLQI